MGTDRHLYVGEVAKLFGVSPSRIRMWENDGLLTVRRTSSGHRLYSPSDVERLRELKRLVDGEGWSSRCDQGEPERSIPRPRSSRQ